MKKDVVGRRHNSVRVPDKVDTLALIFALNYTPQTKIPLKIATITNTISFDAASLKYHSTWMRVKQESRKAIVT